MKNLLPIIFLVSGAAQALEPGVADGTLEFDGATYPLAHAYAYTGADSETIVILSAEPLLPRDVPDPDGPHLRLTYDSEFDSWSTAMNVDGMFSSGLDTDHSIRLEPTPAGNTKLLDPGDFFGRSYDFQVEFVATPVDPDAPFGTPLPAGGGEPGREFRHWVDAVHSGDFDTIMKYLPPEMRARASEVPKQEVVEMLQMFTPAEITVDGGGVDDGMAILQISGKADGSDFTGEVTMERIDGVWVATNTETSH